MCFFVSIIDCYYYIVITKYTFFIQGKKYAEIEEVKWWKELLPNWIDHQARPVRPENQLGPERATMTAFCLQSKLQKTRWLIKVSLKAKHIIKYVCNVILIYFSSWLISTLNRSRTTTKNVTGNIAYILYM